MLVVDLKLKMVNKTLKDAQEIRTRVSRRSRKTEENKICNICGEDVKATVVMVWNHAFLCKKCYKENGN